MIDTKCLFGFLLANRTNATLLRQDGIVNLQGNSVAEFAATSEFLIPEFGIGL